MSKANWNGRIVVRNTEKLPRIGEYVQYCVNYYLENDMAQSFFPSWKSCSIRRSENPAVIFWYDILKTGTMRVVAYTEMAKSKGA